MKRSAIVPSAVVALALGLVVSGTLVSAPNASGYGPGGWDRVGHGTTTALPSLNNNVLALNTDIAGQMIVAGKFTNAGGVLGRNKIARWNGTSWSSIGPLNSFTGDVYALATAGGKIYAGGVFANTGGNPAADYLAVWDGVSWAPFCSGGGGMGGTVKALEVIGNDLYVGGEFQNGAGIASADYLLKCDLTTGIASSTIVDPSHPFTGPVYALTSDTAGNLYAGGNFQGLENNSASDFVAVRSSGIWSNLGTNGAADGAVTGIVRALANNGVHLIIGSDGNNIAGIAQADHVARWNGSAWSALGANPAGTDGYLPASAPISAVHADGNAVWVSGSWLNASGDPKADWIGFFHGAWDTIGSDGAGGGPINAKAEALAVFGGVFYAGGAFTSAGGDSLAQFIARYAPQPPNVIKIPKVVLNKHKGTAVLFVKVPGAGKIVLTGAGIKRFGRMALAKPVSGPGTVKLKVRPKPKTKDKLEDTGSARVKLKIKFTPTGGTTYIKTKTVKLILND